MWRQKIRMRLPSALRAAQAQARRVGVARAAGATAPGARPRERPCPRRRGCPVIDTGGPFVVYGDNMIDDRVILLLPDPRPEFNHTYTREEWYVLCDCGHGDRMFWGDKKI